MMTTIAAVAAITDKKKSSAIAAIIAIIMEPLFSDRSDNDRWDRTISMRSLRLLESGFLMIAAIAEPFFDFVLSDHSDRSDIWKPSLSYASLLNKIPFNNYNT